MSVQTKAYLSSEHDTDGLAKGFPFKLNFFQVKSSA